MEMQPESICELTRELAIRFSERASFLLAGYGMGTGNQPLVLLAGACAAPGSVEAGRRAGIVYDNKRTLVDATLVAVGYGLGCYIR